jgi:hypothetical protein
MSKEIYEEMRELKQEEVHNLQMRLKACCDNIATMNTILEEIQERLTKIQKL